MVICYSAYKTNTFNIIFFNLWYLLDLFSFSLLIFSHKKQMFSLLSFVSIYHAVGFLLFLVIWDCNFIFVLDSSWSLLVALLFYFHSPALAIGAEVVTQDRRQVLARIRGSFSHLVSCLGHLPKACSVGFSYQDPHIREQCQNMLMSATILLFFFPAVAVKVNNGLRLCCTWLSSTGTHSRLPPLMYCFIFFLRQ